MRIEEFDFELPESLIAQTPLDKRDASRLLVLDKNTKSLTIKNLQILSIYYIRMIF